jgi:hypothetical protein
VLIGTNDDEVNYGSTQYATDLILQMPMMYNNGVIIGSGALSIQVPDGSVKGGNVRGMGAVDLQTSRTSASQVVSGNYSIAIGSSNTVSNDYSFAIGQSNTASGLHSFSSGLSNTASGIRSCAQGASNICSGNYSFSRGFGNTASGHFSVVDGYNGTSNGIINKYVFGCASGSTQVGMLGLWKNTTDGTSLALTSEGNTANSTNQCTLQNNNAIAFTVEVVARNTSTGMTGRWETKGLIKRGANASTTALVGTPTVTLTNGDNEAWIVAGAITITADTTNGALAITATGAASTTIHWLAKILSTEII